MVNWLTLSSASFIYLFASSPIDFAVGKIMEGISVSAYWAVSRTATYLLSPNKEAGEATRMIATVTLGGAFGSVITGLIMSLIGAGAAFYLTYTCFIASSLPYSVTLECWCKACEA